MVKIECRIIRGSLSGSVLETESINSSKKIGQSISQLLAHVQSFQDYESCEFYLTDTENILHPTRLIGLSLVTDYSKPITTIIL